MTDDLAIQIRDLTKHFGDKAALRGVDLDVPAGSVFGFLGRNGAGKSTTLNILSGLAKPTAGTVRIFGSDIATEVATVRNAIGYLPDVPSFYGWMTALEFLRFAGELFQLSPAALNERIPMLLDLAGLATVNARIGGYSRGMRQRLGIAQALINAPRLLLLDEPTSALDPMGRKAVLDMMAAFAGRTTIFFSTHVLADVERVADRVAIIEQGRIVRQSSIAELRATSSARTVSLSLVTVDDAARAAEALESRPWLGRLSHTGTGIEVTVTDLDAAQRDIPAVIAGLGVPLVRYETAEASLEEIFLDLVGEPGKP